MMEPAQRVRLVGEVHPVVQLLNTGWGFNCKNLEELFQEPDNTLAEDVEAALFCGGWVCQYQEYMQKRETVPLPLWGWQDTPESRWILVEYI